MGKLKFPPHFGFVYWNDPKSLDAAEVVEKADLGKLHGTAPILTSGWILKDDEQGVSICSEFLGGDDYRNSTFIKRELIEEVRYVTVSRRREPVRSALPASGAVSPDA